MTRGVTVHVFEPFFSGTGIAVRYRNLRCGSGFPRPLLTTDRSSRPEAACRQWEHFGFLVERRGEERRVDKTKVVCRQCSAEIGYVRGNTSNMLTHLKRRHPSINITGTRVKNPAVRSQLPSAFKAPLPLTSDRSQAITKAIGVFIAKDLRPYSVVENAGFKHMLNAIELRYEIPSRPHFSQKTYNGVFIEHTILCIPINSVQLGNSLSKKYLQTKKGITKNMAFKQLSSKAQQTRKK